MNYYLRYPPPLIDAVYVETPDGQGDVVFFTTYPPARLADKDGEPMPPSEYDPLDEEKDDIGPGPAPEPEEDVSAFIEEALRDD